MDVPADLADPDGDTMGDIVQFWVRQEIRSFARGSCMAINVRGKRTSFAVHHARVSIFIHIVTDDVLVLSFFFIPR
jgi:hypothetical protein